MISLHHQGLELSSLGNIMFYADDLSQVVSTINSVTLLAYTALTFTHLTQQDIKQCLCSQILYLSNNRLQEIPRRLPESLEQLTLDRNIISDVPKDAFTRNLRLVKLALNNNMIGQQYSPSQVKKFFVNNTVPVL